jgi:Ca2+-binding RTX toxin-like protein
MDVLSLLEHINAGAGNDTVTGNGGSNSLSGGDGNDNLNGGSGNDTLNGGNGVDGITCGSGNNTINLAITTGQNTGEGTDVISNIENVNGGAGNDTITGSTSNNSLTGGDGIDNLNGGSGNDTLNGGVGSDTLTGGVGNDVIRCNYTQSTTSLSDRISTFAVGYDKFDILTSGGLNVIIQSYTVAGTRTATDLNSLMQQVFTDVNLSQSGNQSLGINSSAFVRWQSSAYLVVNDGTFGFQSSSDLIMNVTGYNGSFDTANKDTLFI